MKKSKSSMALKGLCYASLVFAAVPALAAIEDAEVIAKANTLSMDCSESTGEIEVQKFSNEYKFDFEYPSAPKHIANFAIAYCYSGYNVSSILFVEKFSDGGSTRSIEPVSVSLPLLSNKGRPLGFITSIHLGDLKYDAKNKTLVSTLKGATDTGTRATFAIFEDLVVLKKYESDDKQDGNLNYITIYNNPSPLKR